MRVIKSYVNTERPGKSLLSCQATGGQRDRRGRGGHLNRKKPTNQLPVRFVARRLCSSCSSRRGHDRICNSLPLFTLRCTGFTSRQCGVVAWLRVTSGKGLSPLIQAHSALCVCGGGVTVHVRQSNSSVMPTDKCHPKHMWCSGLGSYCFSQ